jgi:hypothetical protein
MRSDAGKIPLPAPDPEHQRDQDGHGGDNQEVRPGVPVAEEKRRTRTVRSGNGSIGSAD